MSLCCYELGRCKQMTCWKLLAHKIRAPLTILTDKYFAFQSCFYQLDYPKFVGNLKYLGMNNSERWMNEGYDLFAREGTDGIRVEHLARVLGLNKSGFYHYFGDRNSYVACLLQHHYSRIASMVDEIEVIRSFDPEYLEVLTRHQTTVMVNSQLLRNRHIELFANTFHQVNEAIDRASISVWSKYVEMYDQPELALRYFRLIRDVVYARINFDNFTTEFLHIIVSEAKAIMEETIRHKRLSLYSQQVKSEFFSFISGVS